MSTLTGSCTVGIREADDRDPVAGNRRPLFVCEVALEWPWPSEHTETVCGVRGTPQEAVEHTRMRVSELMGKRIRDLEERLRREKAFKDITIQRLSEAPEHLSRQLRGGGR